MQVPFGIADVRGFTGPMAPCQLRGCKNGLTPFPDWKLVIEATKPGSVCLS